ncbi:MAG: Gfo/Idh/MocA family oxidoreductase [Alphaproteobacteria bacterium]|nr:Gfo/Idh/MocA family oxidoreductase [Alphaproteobacteria bacterium]
MTRVLRLGFIGGGLNSAVGTTHFVAAQMDARFRVESGCFSRHADVNTATGQKWGIAADRVYPSSEAFLTGERGRIDAVAVLTPTPDHINAIVPAITAGLPVICEKALASTIADARIIRDTLSLKRGFLAVTYNYTGYPMLRELRALIQGGRFGAIEQIHVEMPQEGFARLDKNGNPIVPQKWRLKDGDIPTIALDLGVHVHNVIAYLTDAKPLEIAAMFSQQGQFQGIVDNVMCMARYSNAIESNIWFSKAALGYRNGLRVRVFGKTGAAEWFQMEPEFLICHDNSGRTTKLERGGIETDTANQARYNRFKSGHPSGFLEAFANLYVDTAGALDDYIKTGRQARIDHVFGVHDAMEGLAMLEAMKHSATKKGWVSVAAEEA